MSRIGNSIFFLGLLVVSALVSAAAHDISTASASVAPIGSPLDDPEHDCFEPVPASVSVTNVTDGGQTVSLEILVLLDGITPKRGRSVMKTMAESYTPLAIELVSSYRKVSFAHDGIVETTPGAPVPTGDAPRLMQDAKDLLGGVRPDGIDVVLILTNKDIFYVDGEPQYGLAGQADCIGGVRYDDHAFAVSEGVSWWEETASDEFLTGKIAAHEVGHLMGAHHHYGNCGEGDQHPEGSDSYCTVMFPSLINYMARNFSTLEGTVVRGHAVDFASP
ncbi:MAG TPA: zinc-dependent metalloprotease family protein [Actinomycetota bacterium]|nr:zinc-dependent metalloprotease family protein [Actinomycetota bacterium]